MGIQSLTVLPTSLRVSLEVLGRSWTISTFTLRGSSTRNERNVRGSSIGIHGSTPSRDRSRTVAMCTSCSKKLERCPFIPHKGQSFWSIWSFSLILSIRICLVICPRTNLFKEKMRKCLIGTWSYRCGVEQSVSAGALSLLRGSWFEFLVTPATQVGSIVEHFFPNFWDTRRLVQLRDYKSTKFFI